MPIAVNPTTGEAVFWDGKAWVPTQTATNPKTGDSVAWDGFTWEKIKIPEQPSGLFPALSSGTDILQGGLYSALEGGAKSLGLDSLSQYAAEGVARNKEEAAAALPNPQSFGKAQSLGEYFTAAKEALGTSLPSMAPMAAGAAAGAGIGSVVPFLGTGVGALIGGTLGGIPGFYGSNREAQKDANQGVVKSEGAAILTAIPQAVMDSVLSLAFPGLGKAVAGGMLTRVVKKGVEGVIEEVPTEIGQQVLERYQAGLPIGDEEAIRQYKEVAIAAGILGGGLGGVGGALQKRIHEPAPAPQTPADLAEHIANVRANMPGGTGGISGNPAGGPSGGPPGLPSPPAPAGLLPPPPPSPPALMAPEPTPLLPAPANNLQLTYQPQVDAGQLLPQSQPDLIEQLAQPEPPKQIPQEPPRQAIPQQAEPTPPEQIPEPMAGANALEADRQAAEIAAQAQKNAEVAQQQAPSFDLPPQPQAAPEVAQQPAAQPQAAPANDADKAREVLQNLAQNPKASPKAVKFYQRYHDQIAQNPNIIQNDPVAGGYNIGDRVSIKKHPDEEHYVIETYDEDGNQSVITASPQADGREWWFPDEIEPYKAPAEPEAAQQPTAPPQAEPETTPSQAPSDQNLMNSRVPADIVETFRRLGLKQNRKVEVDPVFTKAYKSIEGSVPMGPMALSRAVGEMVNNGHWSVKPGPNNTVRVASTTEPVTAPKATPEAATSTPNAEPRKTPQRTVPERTDNSFNAETEREFARTLVAQDIKKTIKDLRMQPGDEVVFKGDFLKRLNQISGSPFPSVQQIKRTLLALSRVEPDTVSAKFVYKNIKFFVAGEKVASEQKQAVPEKKMSPADERNAQIEKDIARTLLSFNYDGTAANGRHSPKIVINKTMADAYNKIATHPLKQVELRQSIAKMAAEGHPAIQEHGSGEGYAAAPGIKAFVEGANAPEAKAEAAPKPAPEENTVDAEEEYVVPTAENVVNNIPPAPNTPPQDTLIFMACGKDKLESGFAPAIEMYKGSYFNTLRSNLPKTGNKPRVMILSAEHGIISSDETIAPYDTKLDAEKIDKLIGTERRLNDTAIAMLKTFEKMQGSKRGMYDVKHIMLVGGADYQRVMRAIIAKLKREGAIGDIGVMATSGGLPEQLGQLKGYIQTVTGQKEEAAPKYKAPVKYEEATIIVPGGARVDIQYEVVELDSLKQAEGELQNRDRSGRKAYDAELTRMYSGFKPEMLGEDNYADRGAPIVGDDNIIDSGNGRALLLGKVYDGTDDIAAERRDAYKAFLEEGGYSTEGFEKPVLIRRRQTEMTPDERRTFVVNSNKDTKSSLSITEQAATDADALKPTRDQKGRIKRPGLIDLYEGGDITLAANRKFVEAFINNIASNERGAFMTADGGLSSPGARRIMSAIKALAYDDIELLNTLEDVGKQDNEILSVGNALENVAGRWAQLREGIVGGAIRPEFDVTKQLVEAAKTLREIRRDPNANLKSYLEQEDMFSSKDPVAIAQKSIIDAFLKMFHAPDTKANGEYKPASQKSIIEGLNKYVNRASEQSTAPDLLGDVGTLTPDELINDINAERENKSDQGNMFASVLGSDLGTLSREKSFEKFFGKSKAINGDGKPWVHYHITPNDFSVFRPGGDDITMSGPAIWLTPNKEMQPAAHNTFGKGEFLTGTNVMPLYVRIENPLYVDDADVAGKEKLKKRFGSNSYGWPMTLHPDDVAKIKEAGYDGIFHTKKDFDPDTGAGLETIVFSSNQLKSAVSNRGAFDFDDPDIRASALNASLPKKLTGAKPRYGFGKKNFPLAFESDFGKALYIAYRKQNPYREWLVSQGVPDKHIDAMGKDQRDNIKSVARDLPSGQTLNVPDIYAEAAPAGASKAAPKPKKKGANAPKDDFEEEIAPTAGKKQAEAAAAPQPIDPERLKQSRAIVKKFLQDMIARGDNNAAQSALKAIKDRKLSDTEVHHYLLAMDITSRILGPTKIKPAYLFTNLVLNHPQAGPAAAMAIPPGRLQKYMEGLMIFSLETGSRKRIQMNAFHEAFHILQGLMEAHDPKTAQIIKKAFRSDMTLDDVDPSIKRALQSATHSEGMSYWDFFKGKYDTNPALKSEFKKDYEAAAYMFGLLAEAKQNGQNLNALMPAFKRLLNFIEQFKQRMGNALRGLGYRSVEDVFSDYAAGRQQRGYELKGGTITSGGAPKASALTGDIRNDKNFKKWAGDTVVVDENGEPAIVYHGTKDRISEFIIGHPNQKDAGYLGRGVYFTNNTTMAKMYAEYMKKGAGYPNIIPAYIRIEKPYYASNEERTALKNAVDAGDFEASERFTKKLQALGHDGVIFEHIGGDKAREYVIFDTNQAKSAFNQFTDEDVTGPALSVLMDDESAHAPEINEGVATVMQGAATAARSAVGNWQKVKMVAKSVFDPLARLPHVLDYLIMRYRLVGRIDELEDEAKGFRDRMRKATKEQSMAIFEYLTTRGAAVPNLPADLRDVAITVKQRIKDIGRELSDPNIGILSPQSVAMYEDMYLPRLYMKYLLEEKGFISTGARMGKMEYAKGRTGVDEETRVALGEVKDPGFASFAALYRPQRDMAVLKFLKGIAEASDKDWVYPNQLIEWKGTKVTAFWLTDEANNIRERMMFEKDPDNKAVMARVADQMQRLAVDNIGDIPSEGYKRLPKSNRYGALKGLAVREEIYNDLIAMGGFDPDPNLVDKIFGDKNSALAKGTQFWKMSKTILNLPTQVRQIISNAVMLNLSGVPLHKVSKRLVQAIDAIRNNGEIYRKAKEYGIRGGGFNENELREGINTLREYLAENTTGMMNPKILMNIAAKFTTKAGDFYQFVDQVFKVAKIIDEVERKGISRMPNGDAKERAYAEAALQGHKWFFDYSLVHRGIKSLRTMPFGAPFITYYYKALPLIVEVATNPRTAMRFAPYIALMAAMPAMVASMYDVDDEDVDKLKMSLSEKLREKPNMLVFPFKDQNGNWQFLDWGYFFPWAMFVDTGIAVAKGDVVGALGTVGALTSPALSLASAIKTNVDPFTGREIINQYDPPNEKMKSFLSYVNSLLMPPIVTSYGAFGKAIEAATNSGVNRYGEPNMDAIQITARAIGFNFYPVVPELQRVRNIKRMDYEIQMVRSNLTHNMKDRSLTPEKRASIREEFNAELKRRRDARNKYIQESAIPAALSSRAKE